MLKWTAIFEHGKELLEMELLEAFAPLGLRKRSL
jgi:hypothetical protein